MTSIHRKLSYLLVLTLAPCGLACGVQTDALVSPQGIHRTRLEASCYDSEGRPRTDMDFKDAYACHKRWGDYTAIWRDSE